MSSWQSILHKKLQKKLKVTNIWYCSIVFGLFVNSDITLFNYIEFFHAYVIEMKQQQGVKLQKKKKKKERERERRSAIAAGFLKCI